MPSARERRRRQELSGLLAAAGSARFVVFATLAVALIVAARESAAQQSGTRSDSQVQQVVYTTGTHGRQLKWLPRPTQTVTLASRPSHAESTGSTAAQLGPAPLSSSAAALSAAGRIVQAPLSQATQATKVSSSSGVPGGGMAQAQIDPFDDPFEERTGRAASGAAGPLPGRLPVVQDDQAVGSGLPDAPGAMPGGSLPGGALPAEPVPRPFVSDRQGDSQPYGSGDSQAGGAVAGSSQAQSDQTGYVFGPSGVQFHCPSPQDKDFYRPLEDLSVDISPPDPDQPLPAECTVGGEPADADQPRPWAPVTYTWKASGLCHKPLYFQQRHVERYGHSWGPLLQPVMSHANFYASVIALPYKMGLTPPNECQYTLGFYRPNSCAPYMLDPLPLSVRAGLWEAGAWVGGVFLMP